MSNYRYYVIIRTIRLLWTFHIAWMMSFLLTCLKNEHLYWNFYVENLSLNIFAKNNWFCLCFLFKHFGLHPIILIFIVTMVQILACYNPVRPHSGWWWTFLSYHNVWHRSSFIKWSNLSRILVKWSTFVKYMTLEDVEDWKFTTHQFLRTSEIKMFARWFHLLLMNHLGSKANFHGGVYGAWFHKTALGILEPKKMTD